MQQNRFCWIDFTLAQLENSLIEVFIKLDNRSRNLC